MHDRFLRACRREPVDRTPAWIMRQAGRYLPEYRELKARHGFLELCRTPELAVEVSLQPLRRFPLDAAIVFSDIVVPLAALGCEIAFTPGPRFARPCRTRADVEALEPRPVEEVVPYVGAAVRMLRRELDGRTPVLGFAGAPFTLAAYMAEGGSREGFTAVREMRHRDPDALRMLLDRLAVLTGDYLDLQVRSGAQAVQLFDSWAGLLSRADYREFALPPLRRIVARLRRRGVPVIYFAVAAGHLLEDVAGLGADVVGLCWRTPLDEARRRLGPDVAVQGNLDPCELFAPADVLRGRVADVLSAAGGAPGHVFNLGHGILPGTPVEAVEVVLETVASRGRSSTWAR
jgi:uroporphyrinogen decarboxylase